MTDVPLREYIERIMVEMEKRYEERDKANQRAIEVALKVADKISGTLEQTQKEQRTHARWVMGTIITIGLALAGMIWKLG